MIYKYFRATGAYEAVQGLSDLFTVKFMGFDVRWDHALLSADCVGFVRSRNWSKNGQPNYLRLKTAVKLHIDQMMRTRNFGVRSDVVERGSVTKSQKGKDANI